MNRITGLRREGERFFLRVQPGVLLSEVRHALKGRAFDVSGWSAESVAALAALETAPAQFFPPDPTETSASVGGMLACNASGAQSFFYGPTRNHVEALRVVLTDGSAAWLRRGRHRADGRRFRLETDGGLIEGALPGYSTPKVKNAAGYYVYDDMDLVDLFIGMEGTLGVAVEIELGLSPAPAAVWGVMAFLPGEDASLRFVRAIRGETVDPVPALERERPVAIEYFGGKALDLLRRQKATNAAFSAIPRIPDAAASAIYVEYHGPHEDAVAHAAARAGEVLAALGGDLDITWAATTPRELERLKYFRHAIPESVNLLIDERRKAEPKLTKLGTDMSVPDDALEQVIGMYEQGLARAGLEGVMFGHIGDNHVHVNILPRSLDEYARGKALYLTWAREVCRLGGSVSAEHGIGKIKPDFLKMMYGDHGIDEMRALKALFDPEGILNPGNLFESARAGPSAPAT
jgi:D-lactate dehydrogenase (cytochrome)